MAAGFLYVVVPSQAKPPTCSKTYTQKHVRAAARSVWRSTSPVTLTKSKHVARFIACARRPESRPAMRTTVRRWKAWRRGHYWLLRWERLSPADRGWAYRTSLCESGRNPRTATGNGFYGAHQWVLSTWHAAGGSGTPVTASLLEQDVRAVHWRNQAGAGQWPVCGH